MEDEQEAELRNPFPSPPSHYTNYTTHNLKLLSLLRERSESEGQDTSELVQNDILSDQSDVPEWPLTSLEKPRVDWIQEEGYYNVFGDTWFVRPPLDPTVNDIQMTRMIAQGDVPFSWRGGRSSAIPRGPRGRYDALGPFPSPVQISPSESIACRPPARTLVHFEVHARHIFLLSRCTSRPATWCDIDGPPRVGTPSAVDHDARTERHGCRERSAAGSGSSPSLSDVCARNGSRRLSGAGESRAHDEAPAGASEGRDQGHS
jgi:MED7 protein